MDIHRSYNLNCVNFCGDIDSVSDLRGAISSRGRGIAMIRPRAACSYPSRGLVVYVRVVVHLVVGIPVRCETLRCTSQSFSYERERD